MTATPLRPLPFRVLLGCVLAYAMLPACGRGASIAEVDLLVSVEAGRSSVATGEGFPLTVTRIWRKDIEPSPWDDGVLSPLVVRAAKTERREDRLRVEETRTFRAYAFTLEDVSVPPVLFVGRSIGGSGKVIARSEALPLRITPALDPEAPGVPEYPAVPQPLPLAWRAYALVLGLALGLGGYLVRRRRRRAALSPPPGLPADNPQAQALTRLARLGEQEGEPARGVADVADIVRHFVGAQYEVSVAEKTSEEVVAALFDAALPGELRAGLRDVLREGDRVKFAAHRPSASAAAQVRSDAVAFVRACGGGPS